MCTDQHTVNIFTINDWRYCDMTYEYQVTPIIGKSDAEISVFSSPDLTTGSYIGSVPVGMKLCIPEPAKYKKAYLATNIELTGGIKGAFISKDHVSKIETDQTNQEAFKEWEKMSTQHLQYFDNYQYTPGASNDKYWDELAEKINYAFGCPPKYNQDVDIQYDLKQSRAGVKDNHGIGRIMRKTFYSNPTILSICPGKVELFPSLFGIKHDAAVDSLIAVATGSDAASSLLSKLNSDSGAFTSGQMYRFRTATQDFARRVNLLCRASAQLLGLADQKMPRTTIPLTQFDYAYWSIRKSYSPNTGDKDKSIFLDGFKDAIEGSVTDKNYIHFVISNNNTSVSEQISTEVAENAILGGLKSTMNSATATLSYFLDTGFNESADVSDALTSALSDGGVGSNWTTLANNLLNGGQMVFPNQITGVNFAQSYSCAVSFVSPYGDPLSVFLWCIVPVMHLMALALPKQVADNVYTFPFICRAVQKGWFNSDLCAITDLSITRGGGDDTSWTTAGLSTEWVVSFTIAPLINSLMVTSTKNPILFMKNDGLIDYLGNLCGFDLKANNFNVKKDLFLQFVKNKFSDAFSRNNFHRWMSDKFDNSIGKWFRFES